MDNRSAEGLLDFNQWLGELLILPRGPREIMIQSWKTAPPPADHERCLLINESVEIMGLKIWGAPTTPLLSEAFGGVSERDRAKLYSRIPADNKSPGHPWPPFGILDHGPRFRVSRRVQTASRRSTPGKAHASCIRARSCRVCTFKSPDTLFVNAALPGNGYDLSNPPHVIRLPRI